MRNSITFAGTDLGSEFGVYCNGDGTFGAPARSYTFVEVPGRNGSLVLDNGRYEDITVSYRCAMLRNFDTNIRRLRNFLGTQIGYQELRDTYHADEYRMGIWSGAFTPAVRPLLNRGEFTLSFRCKPQRFVDDNLAYVYTESGYIQNPWRGEARPRIEVRGTGRIVINNYPIVIRANDDYMVIDCELMDCYSMSGTAAIPRNSDVVMSSGFPVLKYGSNRVFIQTGGADDLIERVEIIPRWWRL